MERTKNANFTHVVAQHGKGDGGRDINAVSVAVDVAATGAAVRNGIERANTGNVVQPRRKPEDDVNFSQSIFLSIRVHPRAHLIASKYAALI